MPGSSQPCALEPVLCNKRSHRNEKPAHHSSKVAPALCTWRKPTHSNVDQHGQRRLTKKPGDTDAGKEPWDQGGRDWQEAAARQGRRGRWPPPEAGDRQRKRLLKHLGGHSPASASVGFRLLASRTGRGYTAVILNYHQVCGSRVMRATENSQPYMFLYPHRAGPGVWSRGLRPPRPCRKLPTRPLEPAPGETVSAECPSASSLLVSAPSSLFVWLPGGSWCQAAC